MPRVNFHASSFANELSAKQYTKQPDRRYTQIFCTWLNSSSTGVERPKIETATFNRDRVSSTSSTVALKEEKGPSDTRTCSPTSKDTKGFGCSIPMLADSVTATRSLNDNLGAFRFNGQLPYIICRLPRAGKSESPTCFLSPFWGRSSGLPA